METFVAFALTVVALTGSPGPANLGLAATGAAFGVLRGWVLMEGVILGVLTVFAVTASGLTGLMLAVPAVAGAATVLAAGYILWLAWRIAAAPPLSAGAGDRKPPSIAGGLLLSLANPKAYAAMAALHSGHVLVSSDPLADGLAKGVTILVLLHIELPLWLLLGAAITKAFRDPTVSRAINIAFAVLLVASMAVPLLL